MKSFIRNKSILNKLFIHDKNGIQVVDQNNESKFILQEQNIYDGATNIYADNGTVKIAYTTIKPYVGETCILSKTIPFNIPKKEDILSVFISNKYMFVSNGWLQYSASLHKDSATFIYVFDRSGDLLSSVQTHHPMNMIRGIDNFCCSMVADTNPKVLYFVQHCETYGLKVIGIKYFAHLIMEYFVVKIGGEICVVCAVNKMLYIFDKTGDVIAKKNFNCCIQSLDYNREQDFENHFIFFASFRNGFYTKIEFSFDEETVSVEDIYNTGLQDAINIAVQNDFVMYIKKNMLIKENTKTLNQDGQCSRTQIMLK